VAKKHPAMRPKQPEDYGLSVDDLDRDAAGAQRDATAEEIMVERNTR
jgi:hypothetical protein